MTLPSKITQEPITFLFRKMWRFANGHRHLVVAFLLMSAAANVLLLAQPLIFREFLNEIQHNGLGGHNIAYLSFVLLGILAVELGFWMFHGPSRVIENLTAFCTERNYRQYLLSGVLGLGLSWHALRDSGDTIDKVNKATDGLNRFASHLFTVVEVLVKAIGTTAILLFFNFTIGLITFVFLVTAFIIIFQFDLRLIPQYKRLNKFENKISARIFDALSNITTVKVLHIEKPIYEGIYQALWAPFAFFRKNKILIEAKWFTGSVMFTLLIVLPLLFYIFYAYRNDLAIEVGTVSALYLYLSRLIDVYFAFAGRYEEMIVNKTRVFNAHEIEESFESHEKSDQINVQTWNTIRMKDIVFRYEDDEIGTDHIKNVAFEFSRGERIALIGESGSGKTTFLKILHGMYPGASALIQFDNSHPFKASFTDVDLKTTLVPQEPEIFSASIRENITLGLDYNDDEIFKASDLAEFSDVIRQLPKGLDSVINEKGVNLSGGQKQRLALARALLFAGSKDIILLDESTSSVDPETEAKIYQFIFGHFSNRTILASIHKMNLLKYFDRIVLFADGRITDQGTFDSLLASNEKFRKEWEKYVAQDVSNDHEKPVHSLHTRADSPRTHSAKARGAKRRR